MRGYWIVAGTLVLAGCASIISGTKQDVKFVSTPPGAIILVDGTNSGVTPATIKLARKADHTVRIELAGYQPYELKLERKLNGWFIGNIAIGGLLGIVIDASNGAMYKLTPNQLDANLSKGDEADPAVFITTGRFLAPAGMQLIGRLQQE